MKRYPLCNKCKFYVPTYNHYPCTKCDGREVPVTCYDCRKYACDINKPNRLQPCKEFEWD